MGWLWPHADAMMDFVRPLSGTILDACNQPERDIPQTEDSTVRVPCETGGLRVLPAIFGPSPQGRLRVNPISGRQIFWRWVWNTLCHLIDLLLSKDTTIWVLF